MANTIQQDTGSEEDARSYDGVPDATLKSVYNFRRVDSRGKLYRSARQDAASPADLQRLKAMGIRTYLDFRSRIEYRNSLGRQAKPIDGEVRVAVPALPDPGLVKPYPPTSSIAMMDLNGKRLQVEGALSPHSKPRRYLIDMFSKDLVMQIFNTAPLYKRFLSLLVLILDVILGNHYMYFVRCFSAEISRLGLVGRYAGLLEHGGKQLCFILNTLSSPENLPAILCCAHGKDRTGIVTAMVLSILGKSDEYIAEDYAQSEEGLKLIQPAVRQETVLKYQVNESFAWAKKETMLKLLRDLRTRYGSVENFLESIGFDRKDQERLRQVLS